MRNMGMILSVFLFSIILAGCGTAGGNIGNMPTFKIPDEEADWIRNGEPLVMEEENWFPQDMFDILLDSEVYRVGEYRGVEVFAEKADVRPYQRLYTKFGKNRFRIFKKTNDQNQSAR